MESDCSKQGFQSIIKTGELFAVIAYSLVFILKEC